MESSKGFWALCALKGLNPNCQVILGEWRAGSCWVYVSSVGKYCWVVNIVV